METGLIYDEMPLGKKRVALVLMIYRIEKKLWLRIKWGDGFGSVFGEKLHFYGSELDDIKFLKRY